MASRAMHVEIVTSLNLKDFLLAFSRFNDVRGKVEVIYSDNCTTFQTTAKILNLETHGGSVYQGKIPGGQGG